MKTVKVTRVQKWAAQWMVTRAEEKGETVSDAIRKIAEAQPPKKSGAADSGGTVEALHERLAHAEAELRKLADEEASHHRGSETARFNHLDSKRQGVSLALSYVEETLRETESGRARRP